MKRSVICCILVGLVSALGTTDAAADEPQLAHMVFFKLKDNSPKAKKELVAACDKYLSGHSGTVYYSAGVLAADLKRDVNVLDFDVSLHLVFKDKASHDKYQTHKRHLRFIKENKANWSGVRVFDSYLTSSANAGPADAKSSSVPAPLPSINKKSKLGGK